MKVVFLYGPPAVGKLTVAKELSKLTGFRIFHNHLTVDLMDTLFGWGTDLFNEFLTKYRLELIEAVAKDNRTNLIFTYVYTNRPYDHFFIAAVQKILRKHNGEIYFVQLVCDRDVLLKRVKEASRKQHGKIKTVRALKEFLRMRNAYALVPDVQSLSIDTSKLSQKRAAIAIQKHWRL